MQKLTLNTILARMYSTATEDTQLVQILEVLPQLDKNVWIAGGALRRTIMGEPIIGSDIDLFFPNEESLKSYQEKMEMDLANLTKTEGLMNVSYTFPYNLITGRNEDSEFTKEVTIKVQLIKIYAESPEKTIEAFDFTICQCAMDHEGNIYLSDFTLWDIARKRLVPNVISYPVSSVRRLLKYTAQGFYVCDGAIADLLNKIAAKPELIDNSPKYID